jgi:hypothetical protein
MTEPATAAQTPDDEAEKLAKARRMAKAFSAPPVAPPEWDLTEEWPMRHKRAGDRRVHATAAFMINEKQKIWTACGKHVGEGGYPLSHMPVDCRACRQATAAVSSAGVVQLPPTNQAACSDPIECSHEAALGQLREKHKASLRRADEINNELMEEVQRYAAGTERPVLWSVYNAMHLRAVNAETELERMRQSSAPVDRAAVLREAADAVAALDRREIGITADTIRDAWEEGRDESADLLRRMAAEAPATEEQDDDEEPQP